MRAVYEAEETAGRAPVFAAACERAILARLRSMTPAEFDALDTGHEGVGQRLYNASRNAATLDAVLDNAKTKALRLRPAAADGPLGPIWA